MGKLLAALLLATCLVADPIAVRYSEATVHGFLALRSSEGKILATGDLTQIVHGDRVTAHLWFRFRDGSLDDDTFTFSQHGVFRLLTDHHIQKGPAFTTPTDLMLDAATGKVTVHYTEKGKPKVITDHMDIPSDLANGILIDVLKNISPATPATTLSFIAATPKPRLLKVLVTPSGDYKFSVVGVAHKSTRFQLKLKVGGIAGLIAPLIGKQPPDLYIWISDGDVPAFVKLVGPQYMDGPIWTIEMASPVWQ